MFFSCSQLDSFVSIVLNSVGLVSLDSAKEYSRFIKELLTDLERELSKSETPLDHSSLITVNKMHMWNFFKNNGGTMI